MRIDARVWTSISARCRRKRASALSVALVGCAVFLSACSAEQSAAGEAFEPAHPPVLTVATAFIPAPGFWQGDPPTSGFEAGLAAALADHLGLDRVDVVQVPFAQIVGGDLGGADLALSQLTPTRKRERSEDFSTPYLVAAPGILVRRPVEAADTHALRGRRWVFRSASPPTPIVMDRIRPTADPPVVVDRADALKVLRDGRADALL